MHSYGTTYVCTCSSTGKYTELIQLGATDDGAAQLDAAEGLSGEVDDGGHGTEHSAFPVRKRSVRLGGKHVRTKF